MVIRRDVHCASAETEVAPYKFLIHKKDGNFPFSALFYSKVLRL